MRLLAIIAGHKIRTLLCGLAILVLVFASGHALAGAALDNLKRGPKIGEKIPHSLTAVDQTGAKREFRKLKGEQGLILLFSRSVDW